MSEQCTVSEQRAVPVDVLGQEIHDKEEQVRDLRQQVKDSECKDSECEVKDSEAPTPGAAKSNKRHREAQDAQAEDAQAQEAEPKRQQTAKAAKRDIWDVLERVCVETQLKCSKAEVADLVARVLCRALPMTMQQVEAKWVEILTNAQTEQRKHFYEVLAERRTAVEERLTSIERMLQTFESNVARLEKLMTGPKDEGNDVLHGFLDQEGETWLDFASFNH